ncbi:uncharacterized protein LOC141601634 [Silene latifolia]|uniref:uncharacterized protein LOC141601634 n=1 Tax=Silene latifolia TaxID=37657 RepID=UPI003D76B7C6
MRWLSKGAEVKVDKQCFVLFSIGKDYSDEVMCDVLPMDTCHLLLGKPWKFDRDCVHQGRENTYSFKLEKRKITLTSLPPALKEIVHILLAKDIAEEAGLPLPAEVSQLLEKYGDVFLEEFPSGLPPLRGIEHHIDLIPGLVLPNKAAY